MTTPKSNENQIHQDLLSVCGLNPFHQHTSSSRAYMFANHLGQMLVLDGSTERAIQTGVEREFAKYTFKVEAPCDLQVIEIIERYRKGLGKDSIEENPETIVIYEDVETKQIGMIRLTSHCSNHQYFGFKYKEQEGINLIKQGAFIAKGTSFLDSPSITNEGGYKYGIELNIAYMTHPATSEDGILVCEDVMEKLGFRTFESRVVEWGNNKYPLNLYGDKDNYKPFPDIGEYIRSDGLLMALRSDTPAELAVVEKSIEDTMEVDFTFDTTMYANGPGGKIVDIKIHHDVNNNNFADIHMDEQAQKYDEARRVFCKRVVDIWKKLHKQRGDALQLTPEFNRFVVECYSVVSESNGQKVVKLYRQAPLDNFRIEFTIEYQVKPGVGFKLTDTHGGKGVLCQLAKSDQMPVDQDGNRADIIMDPNSTISRMNLGRFYEQYINAASRDVHKTICKNLNVKPFSKPVEVYNQLNHVSKELIEQNYNYLLNYYKIVSPKMYAWFERGLVNENPQEYLSSVINKGVALYVPTDNEPDTQDIITELEQFYKPTYGPVTYIGNSGQTVTTKENVRIGSVYFILLEKIGDDWSAVSSGKLQHFGVLSQLTKADKYSKPARNQAVRGAGEAEVRILVSYIGDEFVSEMMDRNNNPATHKQIIENLLSAEKPTDIADLVDRNVHPFGGAKPVQLVNHILQVSGVEFQYTPYTYSPN